MQPLPSVSSDNSTAYSNLRSSNRVDALLALRAFACLMVVVIHCTPPRDTIQLYHTDFSWLFFSHGLVAVWIFFCLSGYLMGKAFYSDRYELSCKGVLNFWRNRALRILPLYSFNILLLSIFVFPEIFKAENLSLLLRLFTFTYQPYLSQQPLQFNAVLWSLSTEVQFYLIVPFVYAFLRNRIVNQRTGYAVLSVIILAVFSFKLLIWLALKKQITSSMYYAFKYWYAPLATNLDVFLIGLLMNPIIRCARQSSLQKRCDKRFNLKVPTYLKSSHAYQIGAVILMILLYLLTAHHFYAQELWGLPSRPAGFRTTATIFILQPVTALVTAFFIFAFELGGSDIPRQNLSAASLLQNPLRILEFFGNLSYGVYLWHSPVVLKITPIFTAPVKVESFYLRIIATLSLSLILATVTYYTIELPAARWKIYRPMS